MGPGRGLAWEEMHLSHLSSGSRQRLIALATAFLFSLLSCGREVTGPSDGVGVRYAQGLSFISQFPAPLAGVAQGVGSVVPFDRVRVVFRRTDGSVALDTTVTFGANLDSLQLSFRVALAGGAPPSGEPLDLSLAFVNAAGDTVFRGGPIPVIARIPAAGAPPPTPATVPLTYTGPGASAAGVIVSPDTVTVVAGDPFLFTAVAVDGQASPIAGTPLVFRSLDPSRATLTSAGAGSGAATALAPIRATSRTA